MQRRKDKGKKDAHSGYIYISPVSRHSSIYLKANGYSDPDEEEEEGVKKI